jgi:hypothetical protein
MNVKVCGIVCENLLNVYMSIQKKKETNVVYINLTPCLDLAMPK